MARILLVEDDPSMAERIEKWLSFEKHSVQIVEFGGDALQLLKGSPFDVVILDWELPDVSGIDVCKQYRARGGSAPVLLLTGKSSVDDKESGLDSGADDYLTKPFHPKELSARVRALLRRPAQVAGDVLRVGDLILDTSTFSVTRGGEAVELLPLEFALLEYFMRHPQMVLSLDNLLDRVWPPDSDSSIEAVRTYIKTLRKKLDRKGQPSYLENVHGVGYRLAPPG